MKRLTLVNYINYPGFKKRIPLGPLSILSNSILTKDEWNFIDLQLDAKSIMHKDVFPILANDDAEYLGISATSLVFPWMFLRLVLWYSCVLPVS